MFHKIKKTIKNIIMSHAKINIDAVYSGQETLFDGKVAAITGGTGDIGFAIAERFLSQGCRVILIGRNGDGVSENEKLKFVQWDISDLSEKESKFGECVDCFGKIDIWVNCAGYISQNDLLGDYFHSTEEDWQQQVDINCKALYFLTQIVARYFRDKQTQWGHIVQVLSIDGIRDTWQPYGISKRAAIEFTKGIAKTLAPYHIVVNGVAPGGVNTRMIEKVIDKDSLRMNSVPNKRIATKEEIANIVSFLASDMADHMIGNIIVCDGGSTLV